MKFHGSLFLEKYAPGFRCSMPWLKITNYVRFQFQLLQIYGKSYTCELCLKKRMKGILAVKSTTQLVMKIKPEKNSAGIAGSRIAFMISVSMTNFAMWTKSFIGGHQIVWETACSEDNSTSTDWTIWKEKETDFFVFLMIKWPLWIRELFK